MANQLRDQLIGAWQLASFVERPLNSTSENHPMGEKPLGIIMYTPDGYMSAQLSRSNAAHFASADRFNATPEEYGRAASNYFAYAGPFDLDEANGTVTHWVAVSLFPNWIGQKQKRAVRIEGDRLFLSTPSPMLSGGRMVDAYLEWRRVGNCQPRRDN